MEPQKDVVMKILIKLVRIRANAKQENLNLLYIYSLSEFRRLKRIEALQKESQSVQREEPAQNTASNAATLSGFGILSTSRNPSNNLIGELSRMTSDRVVAQPQVLKKEIAGDSYLAVGGGPSTSSEDIPLPKEAILQTLRKKYYSRGLKFLSEVERHPCKVNTLN